MASKDPFRENGYARVGASGELEAVPAEEAERLRAHSAYFPERDHAADLNHCFLCGVALTPGNRTEEHVFPRWLLRDADLWEGPKFILFAVLAEPVRSVYIANFSEGKDLLVVEPDDRVRARHEAADARDAWTALGRGRGASPFA